MFLNDNSSEYICSSLCGLYFLHLFGRTSSAQCTYSSSSRANEKDREYDCHLSNEGKKIQQIVWFLATEINWQSKMRHLFRPFHLMEMICNMCFSFARHNFGGKWASVLTHAHTLSKLIVFICLQGVTVASARSSIHPVETNDFYARGNVIKLN